MQPTTTRVPGETDLRRLGIQVTVSGDLAKLRAKILLTKSTHARMLGVSLTALSGYEDLTRSIGVDVALRIGEWYWGAVTALQDALASGIPIQAMVPSALAARYLNEPLEDLELRCARGDIRSELLGVLGYYLYAEDLPGRSARVVARRRSRVKMNVKV